jgi:hypothetical protein
MTTKHEPVTTLADDARIARDIDAVIKTRLQDWPKEQSMLNDALVHMQAMRWDIGWMCAKIKRLEGNRK